MTQVITTNQNKVIAEMNFKDLQDLPKDSKKDAKVVKKEVQKTSAKLKKETAKVSKKDAFNQKMIEEIRQDKIDRYKDGDTNIAGYVGDGVIRSYDYSKQNITGYVRMRGTRLVYNDHCPEEIKERMKDLIKNKVLTKQELVSLKSIEELAKY